MKNMTKQTVTGIIYQGQRALPGVQANLGPLGYSAAQGTAFATRVTDTTAARDLHAASKVAYGQARTAYKGTFKATQTLVMTGRDGLKPYLGRKHSAAWSEAGFDTRLRVESRVAGLLRQVQGLKAYFTAHPGHEIAALDVTAANFDTLNTELLGRIAALDLAKSNVITAAADRDAKAELLREEVQMLLAKLKVMFDPFAAMWELVGFNRPGFVSVPAIPAKLTVAVSGTSASLKWNASARAQSYRVWRKVAGIDADFVLVETREALDYILQGLPAGKSIEIAVSAVNSGGESAKSEVVTVVTA